MKIWTAEKIVRLKRLWAEGHTAAAIARTLGLSPNAVGGKIYRMGLPRRRGAARAARRVRIAAEIPPPPSKRLSILDLQPGQCRWPEDEPEGAMVEGHISFCGHDTAEGYSYCAAHALRAYRAEPGGLVIRKIDIQLQEAA